MLQKRDVTCDKANQDTYLTNSVVAYPMQIIRLDIFVNNQIFSIYRQTMDSGYLCKRLQNLSHFR